MSHDLISIREADTPIEELVREAGEIVRAYREQDSGCVSYVLEVDEGRLFVKAALTVAARASLLRAEALHGAIRSPTLPRLLNAFSTPEGPAHVFEWVPGEILYDYVTMDGERGRAEPSSAHARFRRLPVHLILDALATIYDLHVRIAAAGFVAVDFYDGCILYDFEAHRTWVCDLDEYRPGPFTLDAPRLPGSRRFMAPEEFVRGSVIDQRTNVFTLGRAAAVLLSDGDLESGAWRGSEAMREVLRRATSPVRGNRFEAVADFVNAWETANR
jgi:serine/threonine protein kinase